MPMKLSRLAVTWSRSPDFVDYLNRFLIDERDAGIRYGLSKGDLDPATYIRDCCGIQSRRELDTDEQAARMFHRNIRVPYMTWLSQRS